MTPRKPKTTTNAPGAKFYAAIAGAILTYLLTQEVVDWPGYLDVALNAVAVGLAVWAAPPQRTVGVFALPVLLPVAALPLRSSWSTVLAATGDLHLLFAIVVVLFLLGAAYVGIRLRDVWAAIALVVCAILVAIFLL